MIERLLIALLLGFALGLYIGGKYLSGDDINNVFRKIKSKGTGLNVIGLSQNAKKAKKPRERRGLLKRIFKRKDAI